MSIPRSGWYIVLGEESRLVVVHSEIGLPSPAVRFRTVAHAFAIAEEFNGDRTARRVARDFGAEEVA